MGEFGWAYVSGSKGGINDSVQIKLGTDSTGSQDFTYNIASSTVALTGTLNVSGTINANAFNLDVTNKNVTNLSITGSSKFGDTADDVHQFTGSIKATSAISGAAGTFTTLAGTSLALQNGGVTNVGSIAGATTGTFSSTVSGAAGTFTSLAGTSLALQNGGITNAGALAGATTGTFSSTVSGAAGTFTTLAGTSLALQNGGITNAGAIAGGTTGTFSSTVSGAAGTFTETTATTLNIQNGGITNAGAIAGATTGTFSSTISGAAGTFTTLAGTSLALQGGGVTAAGPIAGATTMSASSNLQIGGSITGSSLNLTGLSAGTATTSSYLALDSNKNIVLTSSSGGGVASDSKIGEAEDGAYTDGLYTDFTVDTLVGVPIDRFNEVLKILAPSPAPALQSIRYDQGNGQTAKLSFDPSNVIANYTASSTNAGFSAVAQNGAYSAATNGANFRLGVYNGQEFTGVINNIVGESVTNGNIAFSSGSFGNAETGTLKLELNGTAVHTVDLSTITGSGNPNTGSGHSFTNGSGFTNISITASSFDGNGSDWYIFKHRTAKYKIEANDQNKGWNYLRVVHTVGSTDNASNYIEWINDPDGAGLALTIGNPRIENISLVGSKYLSGVQYNTNATANYKADLNNIYRNVYPATGSPIGFTVTNSSTPAAQAISALGGSDDHTKVFSITGSLDVNASVNNLLSGSITANVTVTHPLKATISNTGSVTTGNGFLIDNRTLASNNLEEKFHDETFRKTSGSYTTQGSCVNASSVWNSQNHMTGSGAAGHTDGLLYFNQRLYSPVEDDIPISGKFSSLINVSSGQPDYSSLTGTRTFYRILTNSSGVTKRDLKIVSTKNSTTYNNSTLAASNAHFFIKIPGVTGWMNISQNFAYGNINDGAGSLMNDALNDVDSGNNTHHVTFGTASVGNGEYVMIKILADESWSGYITELSFSLGAATGSVTEAPALDDIDANNSGVNAKLSFGAANTVTNYSAATGSSISLSDINSNGSYTLSGDRRGVFSSKQNLAGTLNEDVGASGNNHTIDSFKNAYTGSLVLEVNGINVHTISLGSSLNQISGSNSNTSGFIVSQLEFGKTATPETVTDYTKTYRTGSYHVGPADQNLGWNYARVKHVIGEATTNTNYVEWVVDTDSNSLAASTVALSNFNHLTIYYQSGVRYFASRPSGSYSYLATNVYRNIYSNESLALQFPTTTNCSISNTKIVGSGISTFDSGVSSTGLPNLDNSSNCEQAAIQVTGTVLFDSLTSISGAYGSTAFTKYDVAVNSSIHHPLKSDLTSSTQTKTSFMVYSGALGSTSLSTNEYFNTETYRVVSGNYTNQTDVTGGGNVWNSQTHMNAANAHGDGMVTVSGYAISPLKIGDDGDTRNAAEGGALQAPAGNPNYSTLSEDVRSFYRYFRNTSGQAKPTFTVTLYGDANIVAKSGAFYTGALGENKNINVELKVPYDNSYTGDDDTSTAWGDCVKPYSAGVQPTTDGVGIYSGGGSGLDQTVDGSGAAIGIQLQEKQVRDDQYFVVKITAHKSWTGYLSRILITY